MKKNIFVVMLLLLTNCNGSAHLRFYKNYSNNELSEERASINSDEINKNDKPKKYCVYSISYFLPINFWNLRFNAKQYIKKAIKDLNKEGIKGNNMKNIRVYSNGIGTPIFSSFCYKIIGEVYE
jgi:hypothetical protein